MSMRRDCTIILHNFGILLMTFYSYSSDYLDYPIFVRVVLEFHYVSETFKHSIENVFLLPSRIAFIFNKRTRKTCIRIMHFRTNRALEITETSRLFILSTLRKEKQLN